MSHSEADHNLLVGMLALQLNFVSREQLIAATGKWTRDKSQPLVEILRRDGVLTAEESTLLAGLVDSHLARHGNDALQSLATIDVAQARDVVEATGDKTLQETINHLIESDPHETILPSGEQPADAPDRFATTAPNTGATIRETVKFPTPLVPGLGPRSTPDGGSGDYAPSASRYTIIKPYQRGGLGQVSIARDAEINREVALKEILPKHADSQEARARFVMEAEITGSLEHPGVVPVYGLGQYADGRPYYAMRFIRGDNLQLAIDQFHRGGGIRNRELQFRQLLGRFIDVCNAIEYAHNRCVLHRDLKPGNIMLGKYGETLVVDWGLAKSVDADEVPTDTVEMPVRPLAADATTETQMGRVVGTPAYMSPEQALGRVDLLGPSTDIYSLGATLFHLITGQAPFAGVPRNALLSSVQQGKFQPPRQIKSDIPKPLEAICIKAMANDVADRYLTAHALAEDIERYLADEPVLAYQEPWQARAFRWMRKHRALMVSAAGILTVTAIALTLGVILLGAANQRVEAQRQKAEANLTVARDAVRDYFTSVSEDTLLKQPGMQPLRNRLLGQALGYYEDFLSRDTADPEMRDEVAQANYFVGRIKEVVAASAEAALPYYDEAIGFYTQLVEETPDHRERLDQFGLTLNAKGRVLQTLKRLEESQGAYQAARAIRQQLADAYPDDVQLARQLANTVMNLGTIAVHSNQSVAGMELWNQAQQLRRSKLSTSADQPLLERDMGKGSFNLGLLHLRLEELEAAFQHLIESVKIFEKLITLSPDDMEAQFLLARAYRTLGDIEPIDADATKAEAYYQRAIEVLGRLALRNPQVPVYREELAGTRMTLAELVQTDKQLANAAEMSTASIEMLRGLVQQSPDDPYLRSELAFALSVRAGIHHDSGDAPQRRADLEAAQQLLLELVRQHPAEQEYGERLERMEQLLRDMETSDSSSSGNSDGDRAAPAEDPPAADQSASSDSDNASSAEQPTADADQ